MSDYADLDRKYTEGEKEEALRRLIKAAVTEQTEHYPRYYKSAYAGPEFEGRGFQDYHLKALLDALEKTDALLALGRMVLRFEED